MAEANALVMKSEKQIVFYSSKLRVIHMALNITLAPVLLYLFKVWSWPPTLPHYFTFLITGLIGMRYAKHRLGRPRLALDEEGLYADKFYPTESIRNVQTVMRSLKLTLEENGVIKEEIINLGWASNDDFATIVQLLTERFQREVPDA